jgi:hypothetical protein
LEKLRLSFVSPFRLKGSSEKWTKGVWCFYTYDAGGTSTSLDIRGQYIDSAGNPRWGKNGKGVCVDVAFKTDRYSNKLSLTAAGSISLDQVIVGQTMGISLEPGKELTNISNALSVKPIVVGDIVYGGKSAAFQVEISNPSGLALPESLNLEVQG